LSLCSCAANRMPQGGVYHLKKIVQHTYMQYFLIYNVSSRKKKKKKKNNQQTSISQNRLSFQNWGDETVKAA
ncbi:hypothetical protein, partial [Faecalibacterium duncaniae]